MHLSAIWCAASFSPDYWNFESCLWNTVKCTQAIIIRKDSEIPKYSDGSFYFIYLITFESNQTKKRTWFKRTRLVAALGAFGCSIRSHRADSSLYWQSQIKVKICLWPYNNERGELYACCKINNESAGLRPILANINAYKSFEAQRLSNY